MEQGWHVCEDLLTSQAFKSAGAAWSDLPTQQHSNGYAKVSHHTVSHRAITLAFSSSRVPCSSSHARPGTT